MMNVFIKPSIVLPDFQNTEAAFAHQNNGQLKRSLRLFRMMNNPLLSRIGPPMVNLLLKTGLPVENIIRKTLFDIFVGGTSLDDCKKRIDSLFQSGVRTILDYAVEGENNPAGYDITRDEIIRTVEAAAKQEAVEFSALKVSGISNTEAMTKKQSGLSLSTADENFLKNGFNRLEAICKKAHELGQSVFVDAEESWFQDVIDLWAESLMKKYNQSKPIVYTTIQMYRHDRLAYLQKLVEQSQKEGWILGIKIVRGAYLEKENERANRMGYPTPMQPDKKSTDRDFNASMEVCVNHISNVALCCGSHNEKSSMILAELMIKKGIDPGNRHVVFAQLLGMSDHISFNLAKAGFNAAKYVPYGPVKSVIPYLIRRAAENSSISGQTSRELELLTEEAKRRKK